MTTCISYILFGQQVFSLTAFPLLAPAPKLNPLFCFI